MYFADIAIARVRVGIIALLTARPLEMTGSQPSLIARISISRSATKKFGRELPMKLRNRKR